MFFNIQKSHYMTCETHTASTVLITVQYLGSHVNTKINKCSMSSFLKNAKISLHGLWDVPSQRPAPVSKNPRSEVTTRMPIKNFTKAIIIVPLLLRVTLILFLCHWLVDSLFPCICLLFVFALVLFLSLLVPLICSFTFGSNLSVQG